MDKPQTHSNSAADPMGMWEARAEEIYAQNPSRSAFSRKPMSYESAARSGTRRAQLAQQAASEELGIAVVSINLG